MSSLFNEFDAVSSKQWKQQVQYELKGADYNETLVWESPEGIKVRPFYHADEFKEPLASGGKASVFTICQNIYVKDVEKSAGRALSTLKRGAESIRFTIPAEDIHIQKLLQRIPGEITVYFNLSFLSEDFLKNLNSIAGNRHAACYVLLDPIGRLVKDGNWFTTMETDLEALNTIAIACPNLHFLGIDSRTYQNAGANIVQQIAYTLAHANEYFNCLATVGKPIAIQVAIGPNYFFEIAKVRALRLLFGIIAPEYEHNFDCHIIATPTKRNKTLYDYNVNMLRTTTECMSAILGGADAVANLAYDTLYHKDNEFGDRIARNQLLVLKHESYLDKVDNPADGAYYIEELTQQLAEKALALFKDIEENGGFLAQLKEGTIQRKIAESAVREQELFDSGKEVLLGTNKYPNKNDRMSSDLELYPFVKANPRKTLINPIIEKRLAEKVEQARLAEEEKNQ
ncbi:methylmalonyl-CoA mutase subunit beta [uncultured Flavobacterium sp.]|uniref:methylmalonyl-CoA mutase subunit beta n=1 Tax=uncultured Flavobacterium sp. TaxID=165435 RepID=UPI0025EDE8CD|nr:methylmalonyl-CoA mutase subunit beta [uncultured Flavobacterium sp.]